MILKTFTSNICLGKDCVPEYLKTSSPMMPFFIVQTIGSSTIIEIKFCKLVFIFDFQKLL